MYESLKSNYNTNNHALHNQRGVPDGAVVKNPPATAGDTGDVGSIPESGRSPGVGNGNPLQCSCLENSARTHAHTHTTTNILFTENFHLHLIYIKKK